MSRDALVRDLVDEMFGAPERYGETYAALVVHNDEIVAERYGGALPHFDRQPEPVTPDTPLLSWSMAKSILHAAVGVLVGRGDLALDLPAPVAAWAHDERSAITLEHLLTMRDGLQWAEDYVDAGVSDVIEMLFGSGKSDVANFAIARPLAHPPGSTFNYSSGTSNIVSAVVAGVVGRGDAYERFLYEAIFEPIGMVAAPRFDDAGTFVGASYVYATARDFAKFGRLYLHDGMCDGTRVLPEGWVEHGTRFRSVDPTDGRLHGAHWWVVGDDLGSFWASGYEGQSILVSPPLDLVVVRLGRSLEQHSQALYDWRNAVIAALRQSTSG